MISKGFYFSSKIEKNKGDRDFNALGLIIENACEIGLEEEKSGVIAVVSKNYLSF